MMRNIFIVILQYKNTAKWELQKQNILQLHKMN
jgi:hypothetical protein